MVSLKVSLFSVYTIYNVKITTKFSYINSCRSGECIPKEKQCDNIHDCNDLSDEISCGKFK